MLIINNRIIPFGKSYIAINLFGVIFAKEHLSRVCLNHERIHTAQQKELLFLGFYFIYIIEWCVRLLIHRNLRKAYFSISFEREAYRHEGEKNYLLERRHFAWIRFFKQV